MNRRHLLALLALGGPVAACAKPPIPVAVATTGTVAYTLASGDRLRIIVFGQDNLSNIYAVDATGRIQLPLIGAMPVAGSTTEQAARAIEGRLRAGYIREPRVTVEVDAYRPFFVLGEVLNSGQFPYVNGMTVQTAVAIAGGFTPRAARSYAEITRQIGGRTVTGSVAMTDPVRPGDTIVIEERWF